ncbi:hypothetical protein [Fimbriiglobus ruber]|uniref:hypothetical protein n=1 Tax=Fimbriiglobus ruber TaxID=1908690 RepID=UPI00137A8D07|nr:hypothetical protein [Fimbriiglobus ruber]
MLLLEVIQPPFTTGDTAAAHNTLSPITFTLAVLISDIRTTTTARRVAEATMARTEVGSTEDRVVTRVLGEIAEDSVGVEDKVGVEVGDTARVTVMDIMALLVLLAIPVPAAAMVDKAVSVVVVVVVVRVGLGDTDIMVTVQMVQMESGGLAVLVAGKRINPTPASAVAARAWAARYSMKMEPLPSPIAPSTAIPPREGRERLLVKAWGEPYSIATAPSIC